MLEVKQREKFKNILTDEALSFVEDLCHLFTGRIDGALESREYLQFYFNSGEKPDFSPDTQEIRDGDWTIADVPPEIADRRVEITGPPDRKMIINALNSGARVFMADFEDSNSPTWTNCVQGQVNLYDAVRKTIDYTNPINGKYYELKEEPAVLFVRPRGFHLQEKNVFWNGKSIPASLFDFGMYFFHNAKRLIQDGSRPYFYLPKLQHHLEAKIWNDIFEYSENYLDLKHGTVKATVLIETLPAVFQMDEILYALKDHSAGLNCGRWDYIFSFIKTTQNDPKCVMPDRDQVAMTQHFMRSYTQLLIATCHRRGAHAMGGMAAQIPIKNDEAANKTALAKVCDDKLREVLDGHDGTWVAHPGLIPLAMEIFDAHMKTPNQIHHQIENFNVSIGQADLLCVPKGTCTEAGLRKNIRIGFQYVEAWLGGNGCVPLNNLMEDAATAEISRAQIWQWKKHAVRLDNGKRVTPSYLRWVLNDELGESLSLARTIFENLCLANTLRDFLTLDAYEEIA
ncbi:malate synthase A [archaeon]|nr:malate synthase A [archaeon]